MSKQDFWAEARWAWDGREIADEDVVRISKLPCLGCANAYASVQAPLFVHPCCCGEWHRVCAVCVIREKLVVGNPKHTSTLGRFGPLAKCPYPLRVAHELMGEVETVEGHRAARRAAKNREFAAAYGRKITVSDLKVRTKRLH